MREMKKSVRFLLSTLLLFAVAVLGGLRKRKGDGRKPDQNCVQTVGKSEVDVCGYES